MSFGSLRLGLGLSNTALSGGGGSLPVTGDPLSFTVTGNTILNPDGAGKGVFANGWTAAIVFKGLSASADVNAFDGQKVTLSVSDPGYLSDGTTTTVTRTIKGAITVRQSWPTNGSRLITTLGSDLQLIVALEDIIYQGTTINSVAFASGAYPSSNAITLSGATITNNSTRAYPKPYFSWLNAQYERATGSGFDVEAVAYHRHGCNGQMVACVEFYGKDPANNVSATQRASAPALSSIQTRGNIVEAWKATIPLSGLNQTTSATGVSKVHAKVYPWIGDSTAIFDTSVDGVAQPTYRPDTYLQFVNDKNGTYGGAFAYVKAGVSGGTVSATAATARAAPFPTIASAFAALVTWNNTNRSHNDHSGSTVRLMDDGAGGAVTHNMTAGLTTTAGLCWTTIEPDPLNTAAVNFQGTQATTTTMPNMTRMSGAITIYNTASTSTGASSSAIGGTATVNLCLDGVTMDMSVSGSTGANYVNATYAWVRNVDWKSPGAKAKIYSNTASTNYTALMLGCTAVGNIVFQANFTSIGNVMTDCLLGGDTGGTLPIPDAMIYANNSNVKITAASRSVAFGTNKSGTYTRGYAIVQNLVEMAAPGVTVTFNMSADGINTNMPESLEIYNTVMGNRGNWLYSDNASAAGVEKRGVSRFSLWYSKPVKTDTFAGASGATGNWEWCYGVGSLGTVALSGAATENGTLAQSGIDPSGGANNSDINTSKWSGMYRPSNWYNGNGTTGYATVTFTNDLAGYGDSPGTGGGDYHLTGSTNNAYNRVPTGLAMMAYDLSGVARKSDGTGAAGAYERTV